MKKILATVLALTMIVGMSIIPAFAAAGSQTLTAFGTTQDIPVAVTVTPAGTGAADTATKVYSVDVAWQDLTFNYTESGVKYQWDVEDLQYKTEVSLDNATWSKDEATITVTNKSNDDVAVSAAFKNAEDKGFTLENEEFELTSAADGINDTTSTGTATSNTITVNRPTATTAVQTSIVVTIAAVGA